MQPPSTNLYNVIVFLEVVVVNRTGEGIYECVIQLNSNKDLNKDVWVSEHHCHYP